MKSDFLTRALEDNFFLSPSQGLQILAISELAISELLRDGHIMLLGTCPYCVQHAGMALRDAAQEIALQVKM